MTKLQLLHRAVSERLQAAVEQIMEMVGGTVQEYEEETLRARTENELLRRRLRWMEGENPTDWPDPTVPTALTVLSEADLSEQTGSLDSILSLDALIIKTESIDASDFEAFGHNTGLPAVLGFNTERCSSHTSAPTETGFSDGMQWDSAHSYMAPLDCDPTLPIVKSRSQRMSFACPVCGKVFAREQRLMFHMRVHSTERPYKYRQRKTFYYGDKKRKKKLCGLSRLSREFAEDLSDTSEQTERSTVSTNVSVSVTATEAEPVEASDAASEPTVSSKHSERSAPRPASLKAKQLTEKALIHQCQHCNQAFIHLSRLAIHMKKAHKISLSSSEEPKEQGCSDQKLQQHDKKVVIRNNETEVEKAKAVGQSLFQCPECNKIFARSCWLSFHLKSHIRERALLCRQEKKEQLKNKMKNAPQLSTELMKGTVCSKKIFACPHCDKVFTREGWLGPHIRTHLLNTPQKSDVLLKHIFPNPSQRRSRRTTIKKSKEGSIDENKVFELKNRTETSERVTPQPTISENFTPPQITMESKTNLETQNIIIFDSKSTNTGQITVQSNTALEESSGEKGDDKKSKKTFPCQECGKVYLLAGWLKTHKKMHKKERTVMEKRKRLLALGDFRQNKSKANEQSLVEMDIVEIKQRKKIKDLKTQSNHQNKKMKKKRLTNTELLKNMDKSIVGEAEDKSKESGDKTPDQWICQDCGKVYARKNWLRLHMLGHSKELLDLRQKINVEARKNDSQTLIVGSSIEDSTVLKGKAGGKAMFPCPFCDKVFPRAMRLMVHMQIHSGDQPYSYQQSNDQFYNTVDTNKQEPTIDASDERMKDEQDEGTTNQISAVSHDHISTTELMETVQPQTFCTGRKFSLLPLQSPGGPTIHNTSHARTDSKSDNYFSLQPRIVLDPVTDQSNHSGKEDLKLGIGETTDTNLHHTSTLEPVCASTGKQVDLDTVCPTFGSVVLASTGDQKTTESLNCRISEVLEEGCVVESHDCVNQNTIRKELGLLEKDIKSDGTYICTNEKSRFFDIAQVKNTTPLSEHEKSEIDDALNLDRISNEKVLNSQFISKDHSSNTLQQLPHTEKGYMIISNVSDEDTWPVPSSESVSDKVFFDKSTPSSSVMANDSDLMFQLKTDERSFHFNSEQKIQDGLMFSEASLTQQMKVHSVSGGTGKKSKALRKTLKRRTKKNKTKIKQQVVQVQVCNSIRGESATKASVLLN
ncbi:zinc finger protein Xfin [Trichomycterus rosablanca]|uniref:zinc finger protein Xfin n=1 Tax=Trichomycterus rosablanca TaxID=2290929 RepID=UPI002F360289